MHNTSVCFIPKIVQCVVCLAADRNRRERGREGESVLVLPTVGVQPVWKKESTRSKVVRVRSVRRPEEGDDQIVKCNVCVTTILYAPTFR